MIEDPKHWRHRSIDLTWRLATPADLPRLAELHKKTGKRLNDSTLPDLLTPPVLLALVAEDEHGTIAYGAYVENVAHIRAIGAHRHGLASLLGLRRMFHAFLAGAGFRMAKVNFKRQLTGAVRKPLEDAGFVAEDGQGPNFQFLLR